MMNLLSKGYRVEGVKGRKTITLQPSYPTTLFRGFTLVELMVSVAIFAFMTALLVAKYGNFNNSVLITDDAYNVALALRTAQTYGVSVKEAAGTTDFTKTYGVDFNMSSSMTQLSTDGTACLVPTDSNTYYLETGGTTPAGRPNCGTTNAKTYAMKHATIIGLCGGSGSSDCGNTTTNTYSSLYVVFKRPSPEAYILATKCFTDTTQVIGHTSNGGPIYRNICDNTLPISNFTYFQITLQAPDGTTRSVGVYKNGRIVVNN